MSNKSLIKLSIKELAPLIKNKDISPLELTTAIFERINETNDKLNAYVTLMEEEALQLAKQAENEISNGDYRGPLHGIPLAIKDNIETKGVVTAHGSKIHSNNIPKENAAIVDKLLEAGMIPIGKTNMHEYAYGITTNNPHYGPTRNPWNLDKIPGGSSGGSAAALAANSTIAALGTDTGGSIRIPAALCGNVGLKPTFGRVSKRGVFPLSWTLDHVGPMTKNVDDAALMLQGMAGYDPYDLSSIDKTLNDFQLTDSDLSGVVIGILDESPFEGIEHSVLNSYQRIVSLAEKLGAKIEKIKLPSLEHIPFAALVTYGVEAAAIHHKSILNRPNDFGKEVITLLKLGESFTGLQYIQAQQARKIIIEESTKAFQFIDALLLPTVPITASDIGAENKIVNGEEVNVTNSLLSITSFANVTGLPALAIPSDVADDGLPVGVQLVGNSFNEVGILNIGKQLEREIGFKANVSL